MMHPHAGRSRDNGIDGRAPSRSASEGKRDGYQRVATGHRDVDLDAIAVTSIPHSRPGDELSVDISRAGPMSWSRTSRLGSRIDLRAQHTPRGRERRHSRSSLHRRAPFRPEVDRDASAATPVKTLHARRAIEQQA